MLISLFSGQCVQASGGIRAQKVVVRAPVPAASRSGVRALIKQQHVTHITATPLLRKTVAAARRNFTGSRALLERTRHSVVQIALPKHSATLGSGFVLKEHGKLWVAMPFHLGGDAGTVRLVRFRKLDGSIAEQEVTIALNGTAGWHAPDVSLAQLPEQWYGEVKPLEIAKVDFNKNVYSVGYIAGELEVGEVLPVASRFTHVDGQSMLREFHIPGSTMENPVTGNGYCGAPLFQKINGEWKVVGMHNGHMMDLKNPAASIGSSVNLAGTIPQLIDNYFHPIAMGRGLEFRGWEVTRLSEFERVDSISVFSDGSTVASAVRYLRNFAAPYEDAHVEQVLEDLNLQRGDRLVFTIKGRSATQKRAQREVEFIIP